MHFTSDVSLISLVQRKLEESSTRPVTSYKLACSLTFIEPFQIFLLLFSAKETLSCVWYDRALLSNVKAKDCQMYFLSSDVLFKGVFCLTFKNINETWIYILLTLPCPASKWQAES